jgi:alpha-1,6-mannosyltransferase
VNRSGGAARSSTPGLAGTSGAGWAAIASVLGGYVILMLVSGAAGSPLVPPLPAGVDPGGWVVRGARWLALTELTRAELSFVALGAIVFVLAAFALLLWEAWSGRVRLWAVLAATLVAVALAVAAPVLLSRDVYSYAAYGRILAVHHASPYVRPPADFPGDPFARVASPEWVDTPSVYGPGFTLLSAEIARAWSGSPADTLLAFKVVAGLGVAGAAVFAASAARAARRDRGVPDSAAVAAAAVGLNPVVVLHTVGGGHNDALIALLFAAAFSLAVGHAVSASGRERDLRPGWGRSGREAMVTVLLTLAVLVKAVVAPLLVLWLWQVGVRDRSTAAWKAVVTHVALAGAVAVGLFLPVQAGWSTVRALLSVTSRQGWASGPGLVARGGRALGRAVGGSVGASALDAVASAAFVVLFLALFWRLLIDAGSRPDADRWGGTMLLVALAAPYLLPWYAAWFVPFVGLMRDRGLAITGLAVGGLLALTGVPAEAGTTPHLWRTMLLAVHYVAAPMMLALLGVVAVRVARLART